MPRQKHNQEPLFDPDSTESQNLPPQVQEAAAEDLAILDEITDATREEVDLRQVELLGGSALPGEVQIAAVEDVEAQERMTDEELERIEAIVGQKRISRRKAEEIVLGDERAARLNGEEYTPPKNSSKKPREKSSYPGRNAYKGKTRSGTHPIARRRRQDMIGESDWKAKVHYGPKK